MIYLNGKELISRFRNNIAIKAVIRNSVVIWQAIRSCFGKGYWVNESPWSNDDGWAN